MALNDRSNHLVDANIWIAYFDKTDALSEKAKRIIRDFEDSLENILVTDFILQEVVTVLLYKNKPEQIRQFLDYIQRQDHVEIIGIDTDLWNNTTQFIEKHKFTPKISLTDWSLLFLAKEFNFKLLTFDKQLANTAKRIN